MFALVRFVEDTTDSRLHIIRVDAIVDFDPQHEGDFDNKKTYRAYWDDPDDHENSGEYVVQILKLAKSRKEMDDQMAQKRVPVPRIHKSDLESEDNVSAVKRTARQDAKKRRQMQAAAKQQQFTAVLDRYTKHALETNAATTSGAWKSSTKKKKYEVIDDTSDTDDSLVSSVDLKSAQKEAKFWKSKCRSQRAHIASLNRHVAFLEKKIEGQLDSFQQMLRKVADGQHGMTEMAATAAVPTAAVPVANVPMATAPMAAAPMAAAPMAAAPVEACPVASHEASMATEVPGLIEISSLQIEAESSAGNAEHSGGNAEHPGSSSAANGGSQDFSLCCDGRFHLCNDIYVSKEQAGKIFRNKKPSIMVRDAAQAIWGIETLAKRSISGRPAPTKMGSTEQPAKQLTPEKLDAVYGCLAHWGKENGVDTTSAKQCISRTLSEKIQDCKRKLLKQL